MEHLTRELARLAWQLQRDADELLAWANAQNESIDSTQSAQDKLNQIDRRLAAVHNQTSTLVARVPVDLAQTMTDLKTALLARLAQISAPTQSDESGRSDAVSKPNQANQSNHSVQAPGTAMQLLTQQERRVFQLCFQGGFLTYDEIARHLDITVVAAKNLVNRIFQSERKRVLFAKEYQHGSARVGIHSRLERHILAGKALNPSAGGNVKLQAGAKTRQTVVA